MCDQHQAPTIFLIGFMGCGKTTIGQCLAQRLGYRFIDLDNFIAQYTHQTITQLFVQGGEGYFRHIEAACLHHINTTVWRTVVATGGGTPCSFDNMQHIKQGNNCSIYLALDADELGRRLWHERQCRPLLQHIHTPAALTQYIIQKMGERELFYQQATYTLHNYAGYNATTMAQQIENAIFSVSLPQKMFGIS